MLGGFMTADDAMKRWKYLRDCYVRYKRQVNAYIPSGSCAQPSKKQKMFRFYEVMQFIDDPLESAPTVSNLSDCDKAAGSAQEEDDFSLPSTSTASTCESRPLLSTSTENSICESRPMSRASRRPSQTSTPITTSNTYSESLMSSALRDELKNVLNTPVPQKDAIDYFVACLSDGMRKLSRKKSRHLQIAILQLLAEAEEEEAKEHNF